MFAIFLLALFGLACLCLIADAFRRPTGAIEFPFLASCAMLGFLFPQALGVVRSAHTVPEDGLVKSLVMCVLCVAAVYWGWNARPPATCPAARATRYSLPRTYWFGVALLAVGVVAFVRLTSLTGGIIEYFSVRGGYTLDWRAWPVVYVFFIQFLSPGLALAFLTAFRMRSFWRLTIPSVALAIPLAAALILGRRLALIDLCMIALCTAFFAKGRLLRARLLLSTLPVLALAMFLAPYYRTYSLIGADQEKLRQIPVKQTIDDTLAGQPNEFWTMAYIVHVTDLTNSYEYGRGLYNALIYDFVPKLIVGPEFKEALYWGEFGREYHDNPTGWQITRGMMQSGPGSAYRQFWFFGSLWFYLIARVLRRLFVASLVSRDLFAQAAYTMSLAPSISTVVNDMYSVYGILFVTGPVLLAMRILSQVRQRQLMTRRRAAGGLAPAQPASTSQEPGWPR